MSQTYEYLNKQGLTALWSKIDQQNDEIVEKIKALAAVSTVPIYYDTTENWNAQVQLASEKGAIYIYSDYQVDEGKYVPGVKIGDGGAYVIDLPFIDTTYFKHINNAQIHITNAEREFWNNKISCSISEDEDNLIFTTE